MRAVVESGATGAVVDWERRGKRRRQAGVDTQVNADTPADLARVRAATDGRVLCRVNGWGPWTPRELDLAVSLGADEVLLPMVRTAAEVDAALAVVAGRCGLGILVETVDAVDAVEELVRRPLSRVYLGLNDLMIDRLRAGTERQDGRCLFDPLVDGTADLVAGAAAAVGLSFGAAGLTRPDAGHPVPCRLLVGELARLGASFTFLRRSFHADTAGRRLAVEVPRIQEAVVAARSRPPQEVVAHHARLEAVVERLHADEAEAI
ncbi:MAG TPA: hypothetical protein VHH09_03175 [Acidimicrobiales bacterium]|nr:hypothetical protein [Acidimicrobiales bacterium]